MLFTRSTTPTRRGPTWLVRFFLVMLMATGAHVPATATSVTPLRIAGLPCVADTVDKVLYSTLPASQAFPATLEVSFDADSLTVVTLDGQTCTAPATTVTVDSFDGPHELLFSHPDREPQTYRLVFTRLPLVSLDGVPDVVDRTKRPCHFSLVAAAQSTFDNQADDISEQATIKIRGASSTIYPKKSYGIEIVDSTGEELDCPLLGLREDGDWILEALYSDYSKMRKQLCFDLWLDQSPSPVADAKYPNGIRGRHVEVFINGRWHGLYVLSEKVDRKQLGIKKVKEDDATGEMTIRGISFKGESWSDAIYLNGYDRSARTDTIEWQGWSQDYPDEDNVYSWDYLKELIDFTSQCATLDDADFDRQAPQWFDMDNVVDYVLFLQLTNAVDNCLKNTFLSTYNVQDDTPWFFTPWDLDATFGRMPGGDVSGVYGFDLNFMQPAFFRRMMTGTYAKQMQTRWAELKTTVWSTEAVNARIDAYADLLVSSGAWAREQQRWPEFCGSAADEATFMKDWYARNFQVVDSVLNSLTTDIPTARSATGVRFAVSGHVLTVTPPAGVAGHLAVYDASGRCVTSRPMQGCVRLTLPAGVFVVTWSDGQATQHEKIVIR